MSNVLAARCTRTSLVLSVSLLGAFAPHALAASLQYASAYRSMDAGGSPWAMVMGDFDEDGAQDIAANLYDQSSIFLYYGHNDGTFSPPVAFPTHTGGFGLCAADFNLDGHLDIVQTSITDHWDESWRETEETVLFGTGARAFAPALELEPAVLPLSPAAADVNGDGRPDLAFRSMDDDGHDVIVTLLATSDGGFGPATTTVTCRAYDSGGFALVDVNHDGFADIVQAFPYDDVVGVFLGHGDGSFGARVDYATAFDPVFPMVADVDGDGHPDIVASDNYSSSLGGYFSPGKLSVLRGFGDGTFAPRQDVQTNCKLGSSLDAVDVDGDGHLDLLQADAYSGVVFVLRGQGDGTFVTDASYPLGVGAASVVLRDISGDGLFDIVAASSARAFVMLTQNADRTFGHYVSYATSSDLAGVRAVLGDLDADTHLDAITLGRGFPGAPSGVSVFRGAGDGTFGTRADYSTGSATDLALGDLNEDGHLDVVTGSGVPSFLAGVGDGTLLPASPLVGGTPCTLVALGDVNEDTHVDVVTMSPGGGIGSLTVHIGNGDGSVTPMPQIFTVPGAFDLRLADVNGDHHLDIVFACRDVLWPSNTVVVLAGRGDGNFGLPTENGYWPGLSAFALGDVDEDGITDLVVTQSGEANVSVMRGDGSGSFGTPTEFPAPPAAVGVVAIDVDHDGHLDLVVGSSSTNLVSVLRGDGSGHFDARTDYGAGGWINSVAPGDLTGDGFADILVCTNGAVVPLLALPGGTTAVRGGTAPDDAARGTGRLTVEATGAGGATFRFRLASAQDVSLRLYDMRGALVARIAGGRRAAGAHRIHWEGAGLDGRFVASGVYTGELALEGRRLTRRFVLVR